MRKFITVSVILVLFLCAGLCSAYAKSDNPVSLSVFFESDPDNSDFGTVSFTVFNSSDLFYTMYQPTLDGALLDKPMKIYSVNDYVSNDLSCFTLAPGEERDIRVSSVRVPHELLNLELLFTLSWDEAVFAERDIYQPYIELPDDVDSNEENEDEPLYYISKETSTSLTIEKIGDDSLQIFVEADDLLVRSGTDTIISFRLANPSTSTIENITLYDEESGNIYPLPKNFLNGGESMNADYSVFVSNTDVRIMPCVEYSIGNQIKTVEGDKVVIQHMFDSLSLDVRQYSTDEGNFSFVLTVSNTGTHTMRFIHLTDGRGNLICPEFSLPSGQSSSVTYSAPDTASGTIQFVLEGTDWLGSVYTCPNSPSYVIQPGSSYGQVSLMLNVTISEFDEEMNSARLLFEIRNYSNEAIFKAEVAETSRLNKVITSYSELSKGIITFTKDFSIGNAAVTLSFIMSAEDEHGNRYVTEPVSLDISPFTASVHGGTASMGTGKVISPSHLLPDIDWYGSSLKNGLLILFAAALLILIFATFLKNDENILLVSIPDKKEEDRLSENGDISRDTARTRYGYIRPAKLRYGENTDGFERVKNNTASIEAGNNKGTGTYKKQKKQVTMLTREDTRVFSVPLIAKKPTSFFSVKEDKISEPNVLPKRIDEFSGTGKFILSGKQKGPFVSTCSADNNQIIINSRSEKVINKPENHSGFPYSIEIRELPSKKELIQMEIILVRTSPRSE